MPFLLHLQSVVLCKVSVAFFAPDEEAVKESYKKGDAAFPYWSRVWPAALGLGQFLIRHPRYTRHKKVLELAGGLGLPSLVAARNAASVVCSDYVPEAVAAVQASAAHSNLQNLATVLLDWRHLPEDLAADVLLLSDVSYDPSLFTVQEKIVRRFLAAGSTVIISTPQRLTAKEALAPLLPFCTVKEEVMVTQNNGEPAITVMVLEKS